MLQLLQLAGALWRRFLQAAVRLLSSVVSVWATLALAFSVVFAHAAQISLVVVLIALFGDAVWQALLAKARAL